MIRRNKVIATLLVAATVVNIGATKVMAYESIINGQVVNTLEGYLSQGNSGYGTEGEDSSNERAKEGETGASTELSNILSVSSSSKLVNNLSKSTSEGFAFSQESTMKTGSGGYNDDGTEAEDAQIIYITAENIITILMEIKIMELV